MLKIITIDNRWAFIHNPEIKKLLVAENFAVSKREERQTGQKLDQEHHLIFFQDLPSTRSYIKKSYSQYRVIWSGLRHYRECLSYLTFNSLICHACHCTPTYNLKRLFLIIPTWFLLATCSIFLIQLPVNTFLKLTSMTSPWRRFTMIDRGIVKTVPLLEAGHRCMRRWSKA